MSEISCDCLKIVTKISRETDDISQILNSCLGKVLLLVWARFVIDRLCYPPTEVTELRLCSTFSFRSCIETVAIVTYVVHATVICIQAMWPVSKLAASPNSAIFPPSLRRKCNLLVMSYVPFAHVFPPQSICLRQI